MRTATSILFLVTLLTALLPACKEVKRDVVATPANRDSVVSMKTRDVMTLISDSGMTRYRITAKLWLVYDEARRPNWKFPYGLFLEKFDDNFKVEATIRCDSAFYLKNSSRPNRYIGTRLSMRCAATRLCISNAPTASLRDMASSRTRICIII